MERHLFPNVEDYDVEEGYVESSHESFYWSGVNAANSLLRSLNEVVEELAVVGYAVMAQQLQMQAHLDAWGFGGRR